MSTRSSIAYFGRYHLYADVLENEVYLDDRKQTIHLMSEADWEIARQQIISGWLQEVANGHASLAEVWGDSICKLDRPKLVSNFSSLLSGVKN